jgi:hypothetical protein
MEDSTPSPSGDRLVDAIERGDLDEARGTLDRVATDPASDGKACLRSLRSVADGRPAAVGPLCPAIAGFLTDDDRSVRLTAAKLLVAVAGAEPGNVVPVVPALADRLADETEFYFVRARAAEALGYVALEYPDRVTSPGTLADLRVGLSFDEPEVTEKLAKALEHVALGDPPRLRHQVDSIAAHLDDGSDLVRYHLTTALAAVGCHEPDRLATVREGLVARLADDCYPTRGRAAEALGLLAGAGSDDRVHETLEELVDDEHGFVTERARFALRGGEEGTPPDGAGEIGTVAGIRATTDEAVEAIRMPNGDDCCPQCGLALPEGGPPFCPRCGAPN